MNASPHPHRARPCVLLAPFAAAAQSARSAGDRCGAARTGAEAGAAARPAAGLPATAGGRQPAAVAGRGAVPGRRDLHARRPRRRHRRKIRRGLRQGRVAHAPRDGARGLAALRLRRRRDLGQGRRADPPRHRLDHRTRAALQARRGNRILRLAALLHRRERFARKRGGDPLRGPRPLRGDATRATRPASRRARTGISGWTSSRSTGRGWSARATMRRSISSARRSSIRRGSSFRCRASANRAFSRRRWAPPASAASSTAQPYYLNLAPNYDATITPRLMTKRGVQIGGQGRYLFDNGQGEATARVPAQRSRHRHEPVAACRGGTRRTSTSCRASSDTGTSTRFPTTPISPICRTGSGSRRRRRCRARADSGTRTAPWQVLARAQAFQTLQDPTAPPAASLQPRAAVAGDAAGRRLERAHVRGRRRIRVLPQPDAGHGPARLRVADRRVETSGRGVVFHREHRRSCAALRPQRHDARRPDEPRLRDSDLLARRRPRLRARLERLRAELRADARAARLLRLCPVQGPEQGADLRHGDRRLQFRAALQHQPLSRQRPDRRRQPGHARADVAAARSRHRRRAAARCRRRALLLPGPARRAERGAARRRRRPMCSSASRVACPTRGRSAGCGSTTSTCRRPSA